MILNYRPAPQRQSGCKGEKNDAGAVVQDHCSVPRCSTAPDAALYIRPTYWAERSGKLMIAPDPESTQWCLTLYEAPMRPSEGFSITLSPWGGTFPTRDTLTQKIE